MFHEEELLDSSEESKLDLSESLLELIQRDFDPKETKRILHEIEIEPFVEKNRIVKEVHEMFQHKLNNHQVIEALQDNDWNIENSILACFNKIKISVKEPTSLETPTKTPKPKTPKPKSSKKRETPPFESIMKELVNKVDLTPSFERRIVKQYEQAPKDSIEIPFSHLDPRDSSTEQKTIDVQWNLESRDGNLFHPNDWMEMIYIEDQSVYTWYNISGTQQVVSFMEEGHINQSVKGGIVTFPLPLKLGKYKFIYKRGDTQEQVLESKVFHLGPTFDIKGSYEKDTVFLQIEQTSGCLDKYPNIWIGLYTSPQQYLRTYDAFKYIHEDVKQNQPIQLSLHSDKISNEMIIVKVFPSSRYEPVQSFKIKSKY